MVELSANASPSSAFIRFSEVKIDFEWSRTFSSRGEASYEVRDGRIWQMGDKKAYSPFKLAEIYLEFAQLQWLLRGLRFLCRKIRPALRKGGS